MKKTKKQEPALPGTTCAFELYLIHALPYWLLLWHGGRHHTHCYVSFGTSALQFHFTGMLPVPHLVHPYQALGPS